MRLWKRAPDESVDVAEPEPTWTRRPPVHCAGCKRASDRYVYLQNGKDYCVPCTRTVRDSLGIRPGGRRTDDILDLESA